MSTQSRLHIHTVTLRLTHAELCSHLMQPSWKDSAHKSLRVPLKAIARSVRVNPHCVQMHGAIWLTNMCNIFDNQLDPSIVLYLVSHTTPIYKVLTQTILI